MDSGNIIATIGKEIEIQFQNVKIIVFVKILPANSREQGAYDITPHVAEHTLEINIKIHSDTKYAASQMIVVASKDSQELQFRFCVLPIGGEDCLFYYTWYISK